MMWVFPWITWWFPIVFCLRLPEGRWFCTELGDSRVSWISWYIPLWHNLWLSGALAIVETNNSSRSLYIAIFQRLWLFLVGGWATHLKHMKVNWDDDIPNIWTKIKVPNHQPDSVNCIHSLIGTSDTDLFIWKVRPLIWRTPAQTQIEKVLPFWET